MLGLCDDSEAQLELDLFGVRGNDHSEPVGTASVGNAVYRLPLGLLPTPGTGCASFSVAKLAAGAWHTSAPEHDSATELLVVDGISWRCTTFGHDGDDVSCTCMLTELLRVTVSCEDELRRTVELTGVAMSKTGRADSRRDATMELARETTREFRFDPPGLAKSVGV